MFHFFAINMGLSANEDKIIAAIYGLLIPENDRFTGVTIVEGGLNVLA
jgi:hypothetical protein